MCVKLIAPAPNEMTPATCVAARKKPCDESVLMFPSESFRAAAAAARSRGQAFA